MATAAVNAVVGVSREEFWFSKALFSPSRGGAKNDSRKFPFAPPRLGEKPCSVFPWFPWTAFGRRNRSTVVHLRSGRASFR